MERVSDMCAVHTNSKRFNAVLVNVYQSKEEKLGAHSDAEQGLW